MNKLMTLKEVAKELRVTTRTIHNYINSGKLKTIKIGKKVLIKESELKNLIKKNERVK